MAVPTLQQAHKLLHTYNSEPFHMRHGEIVSGVMGYFSREYDPEHENVWRVVGLLHDVDYERWPEEHCMKGQTLLREADVDEDIIRACMSHGWPLVDLPPESQMEKVLYAVDELTGLIGAVAIMRPSKSVMDLELKSVKKKFKTPAFAAGCSREVIERGAQLLDMPLDTLIEKTILAMRAEENQVES